MTKRKKKDDRSVDLRFVGGPAEGRRRWDGYGLDLCFRLHMNTALYVRTGEFEYTYHEEGETNG
jgi:hypothetical protein